jgi:hypothetical protein
LLREEPVLRSITHRYAGRPAAVTQRRGPDRYAVRPRVNHTAPKTMGP